LVETWPVLVEDTYGCNVVGSVDGTRVVISALPPDPVAGGAALDLTT
jgi:hypothetical protein